MLPKIHFFPRTNMNELWYVLCVEKYIQKEKKNSHGRDWIEIERQKKMAKKSGGSIETLYHNVACDDETNPTKSKALHDRVHT